MPGFQTARLSAFFTTCRQDMAFGPSEATLVSVIVESMLFGYFTILFAATLYILIMRRRKGQHLNKPIIAVSVAMYTLSTIHIAINIQRIISGFITFPDRPGGPAAYFNALTGTLNMIKNTIYVVQTILGDGFVIYRLYIVWNGDKRLVVPALIGLLGCSAASIGTFVSFFQVPTTTTVFNLEVKHWLTAQFVMTLATNFSCTALIAFRIWWAERQTSALAVFRSRSLSPVMVVIIESGAIYSAALITMLATYLSNSWAQYVLLEMISQLIGVVFSLVIVRIGLGITSYDTMHRSTQRTLGPSVGNRLHSGARQPVAVQMTRTQTTRDDCGDALDISLTDSASSKAPGTDAKVSTLGGSDDEVGQCNL